MIDYSIKKTCSRCGESLPLEFFPKNGTSRKGTTIYRPECRECRNQEKRRFHAQHRDRENARRKKRYYANPWTRKLQSVYGTRRDAPGIITVADLKEIWRTAAGACEYCGRGVVFDEVETWTFDHATPLCRGGTHDPDNLRLCCAECNRKKRLKTESEFRLDETGVPF